MNTPPTKLTPEGFELLELLDAAMRFGYPLKRNEAYQKLRTCVLAFSEAQKGEAERYEACKREAQQWKQEARTANTTIAEIYQLCTDKTGEPGNWNGAQPVRELIARLQAVKTEDKVDAWLPIETAPKDGSYFLASNQWGVWVCHHQPVATSGYVFEDPWRSVMLNHWHMAKNAQHNTATHWKPLPASPAIAATKDSTP